MRKFEYDVERNLTMFSRNPFPSDIPLDRHRRPFRIDFKRNKFFESYCGVQSNPNPKQMEMMKINLTAIADHRRYCSSEAI